ncbi:MAG: non-canonical purine NTP pyrophosphatase [Actinobacteria bacterium]|uniref:Unannotated protein n=1 Tax=freshwater metagenome TaxID=449393 RepID=A0A6J6Q205_9ZZZZ|nr:non-canonical purine NTP pyrophosphatase [Actinomycetota bacterium]
MLARLASQNAHKLGELRLALPGWTIDPIVGEAPDETGDTYEANARIKAVWGRAQAPDVLVIGEDSGIECAALDGAPGLHSARWAPGLDQADALLARLATEDDRRARMVTVIVAHTPDGREIVVEGVLEGTLARDRRGTEGFGYDPIFVPLGETRTVAEIGEAWKNENSHRARAAHALRDALSSS